MMQITAIDHESSVVSLLFTYLGFGLIYCNMYSIQNPRYLQHSIKRFYEQIASFSLNLRAFWITLKQRICPSPTLSCKINLFLLSSYQITSSNLLLSSQRSFQKCCRKCAKNWRTRSCTIFQRPSVLQHRNTEREKYTRGPSYRNNIKICQPSDKT